MKAITVHVIAHRDRPNLFMRYVDPLTRQQFTRSTGTTKRREAEKIAAKWEADLREGRYTATTRISWEDFRERYDEEKLATLSPKTAQCASVVFNHVERILRPRRLSDLNQQALGLFQTQLRKTGIKETTIAGHLRHLRAALSWAVRQKMLAEVPLIEKPHRASGITKSMRGRPITAEEYERMLAVVPDVRKQDAPKWVRFLEGLWLSGLRLGEGLALSWDLDAPICVSLTSRFPKLRIWAEAQKSHRDQQLPLTPDFAELLLAVPEEDRHGLVFGIEGPDPGRPLSEKRASRTISAIGKRAGVVVNKADGKFASAHDLRRAFGTRWAKRIMPATLQLLMRHSSIETTLKYYVEQDADEVSADLWNQFGESGRRQGRRDENRHRIWDVSPVTENGEPQSR